MKDDELDRLLNGGTSVGVTLAKDDGSAIEVLFTRHELASPTAFRAALRRALGHEGYEPPRYDQEDHDTIVRVMFQLAAQTGESGG